MIVHSTAGWAEDLFGFDDYHWRDDAAVLLPPLPGVPYLVSEAVGAIDGPPTGGGGGSARCHDPPASPCRQPSRRPRARAQRARHIARRLTGAAAAHRGPNVTGEVTLSITGAADLIGDNPFSFTAYGGVGGVFVRGRPARPARSGSPPATRRSAAPSPS